MENRSAAINTTIEKNYDSDFCGSIPLHLVNLIQPHGILLVLDKQELLIMQASENVETLLFMTVDEVLEQPLSAFITAGQMEELQVKLTSKRDEDRIPQNLTFSVQDRQLDFIALIHTKENYVILELEENTASAGEQSFIGIYQQIKYITSLLKQAATTADAAHIAAAEIKKITRLDRVLVYQFDPQWNGIVIAQAKEEDMDDYMDLRFPASDVPKQARDLYLKNPYRLIPTKDYEPVRLIPIVNPITQTFTDLSDCNLRSVATVHLEYLTNLKITASMSLPIIIEDKLWGLISCHHKTKFSPSYEQRSGLELLSTIISAQLDAKERERNITLKSQLRGVHALLLEQLYSTANITNGLLSGSTTILDMLSLSGAAILYDNNFSSIGELPDIQRLKELVSWLRRNYNDEIFATDNLVHHYSRFKDNKEVASGLIALPINSDQGEYILGFRPEVIQTVKWGGDPNRAIQMESDGKTYHPRNSFATYKETVKHTSLPWHKVELEAAETLRSAVLEKILKEKY